MPRTLSDITEDVIKLPREERLALVRILLDLDDSATVAEVEISWNQEIRERISAYDEGNVKAIPFEELQREMRDRFAR